MYILNKGFIFTSIKNHYKEKKIATTKTKMSKNMSHILQNRAYESVIKTQNVAQSHQPLEYAI